MMNDTTTSLADLHALVRLAPHLQAHNRHQAADALRARLPATPHGRAVGAALTLVRDGHVDDAAAVLELIGPATERIPR